MNTPPSQFVPPKGKPVPSRNPSTLSSSGPVPHSLVTPSANNPRVASSDKKKKQKIPPTPNKSRFIFSVDDAEDEIEQDLEREYLEGYNDALRGKLRKKLSKNPIKSPKLVSDAPKHITDLETSIVQNLARAEEGLRELEFKENDLEHSAHESSPTTHPMDQSQEMEEPQSEVENDGADMYIPADNGDGDSDSISSMESFTLRERQDAINTTHPFGIRIWKPALYKKMRSVQKEADLDIHEEVTDTRALHASVYIGNVLWTFTFGAIAFIVCIIGLLFSMVCFGWTKRSLAYAKLYWKVGLYILHPFGKVVYLYKDEKYRDEDVNEGSSINEYRRWINDDQEAGFLFTSGENRPLLEDSSVNTTNYNSTSPEHPVDLKLRLFGRGQWSIGRICFFIYFYLVLQPVLFLILLICWLCVFTIPMSKLIVLLCLHLRQRPLSIFVRSDKNTKISSDDASVLLCTYRASGLYYYKYTVDGTNVIILNLMALVGFVIADYYVLKEALGIKAFITDLNTIFVMCLLSIIPLAYFIGQAVALILAQLSMGLGAVINAFFSTIVEIFLYCVALKQEKGLLVEGSMIGSILGAVLLLPGLLMCAGAIKRKTQRYNPRSAGVSSTMLLFLTVVMFTPTIFHQIFGLYDVTCVPCKGSESFGIESVSSPLDVSSFTKYVTSLSPFLQPGSTCQVCHILQPPLKADKLYLRILKPLAIFSVTVLFVSYGIALLFTLRTHAALIWQTPAKEPKHASSVPGSTTHNPRTNGLKSPSVLSLNELATRSSRKTSTVKGRKQTQAAQPSYENSIALPRIASVEGFEANEQEEAGGHDAPNWLKTKSSVILLGATVLYAVIAEILVDCVDEVLKHFPISAKFLGLTVFALVPNTTEFLNAISFAMYGNVALSMEIGSAYVLQVIQLQIPALVLYLIYRLSSVPLSLLGEWNLGENMLSLIFSRWDCIASVISVYIFTYIYAEGKSNYFKGSILILLYLVVMLGFYYTGEVDPNSFMN